LITYVVIIFIIFLIIEIVKSPSVKGIIGESHINKVIARSLNSENYRLLKNVTFPTDNGSTQIDHLLVSKYGVFVIETKNMQGWIFGGAKQATWTQKIYRHTSKFQNPLHQNYKHTQTVQATLGLTSEQVFSLVVFLGHCDFKTTMPENVVYPKGMIRYIQSKLEPLISDSEMERICSTIESQRLAPTLQTRREHIRHVKTVMEEKQYRIKGNRCPKCGQPMVLRTSKSGAYQGRQFWGCSAFPKCRTVRSV
jgi:restriction system protein